MEKLDELSECGLVSCALMRVVPAVIDVPASPSSVVTEFCDLLSFCCDRKFVEPQSFSFSKKRALWCTRTQEEMRQNSYTSFEREQESYKEEGRGWNARDRTIIARTKQFLEKKLQCEGEG